MVKDKVCKKCGKRKEHGEFTKDKNYKDGYFIWCKECLKLYRKSTLSKSDLKQIYSLFEKYRTCKYLTVDYEGQETDEIKKYRLFCQQIEVAVNKLPGPEKKLVTERFMKDDYISDYDVYTNILMITSPTFTKQRDKALARIELFLRTNKLIRLK